MFKLNLANFVYSTLDFESPQIFHDWFIFNHEINNYNTRLSATINQEQYFDNGTVEPSLTLIWSKNDQGIWIHLVEQYSRNNSKINLYQFIQNSTQKIFSRGANRKH